MRYHYDLTNKGKLIGRVYANDVETLMAIMSKIMGSEK